MAVKSPIGITVSYECSELIEELSSDIREFGDDLIVEVVTEDRYGVTIYKDYNFLPDQENPLDGNSFILEMNERIKKSAQQIFWRCTLNRTIYFNIHRK